MLCQNNTGVLRALNLGNKYTHIVCFNIRKGGFKMRFPEKSAPLVS